MAVKICPYCGEEFVARNNSQKFCSKACSSKTYQVKRKQEIYDQVFNKRKYTCQWCGKEFGSNIPREFCNYNCQVAYERKRKKDSIKNAKELVTINELARKEGLTYGQYMAKYGY